ncbi:bifunctional cytochrome P450/NADPH--P450 reductase [Vineibacter terrae]|uniref:bifunctional cytochrome P450/NADPH--P450 reductase n=1 Tax=Vineibacter terrae TaxID=2586908 RepID=UPI002E37EE3F|nr:cytochrome P450 [Vineibacter terrae]HEX2887664.1 cytochrome P450 [Vineibacter terrae]
MSRGPAQIPQPRVRPIVGNVPDVGFEVPIQNMMKLAAEHGPIYRLAFPGGGTLLVLSSAELVSDACDESRFEKFVHGSLKHIRDFAGDGLFTAYGNEPNWAKAHRILMPAFGPAAMRNYFDDMLDIADQMLTRWERFGPAAPIDVADNMTRLTLDTIALCGFGNRFNSFYQREMHVFVDAMVRALAEAGGRANRVPLQTRLMLMTQRQYDADCRLMHQITDDVIAERRRLALDEAPRDLLNLMLTAKDPVSGDRLDDANIRNQLVTFLIAGHETTSGLLSFTTHLLLEHPEALARARAEVDAVLGDGVPRFEDIAKLTYIDQVLRESIRLWPTAPFFAVRAKDDTVLAGRYPLKKGDVLSVLTPSLHRDASVWPDPTRFDPDRFAPDRREKVPPHAWLPFGNGVRACIGRAFAWQESLLVIAMMLQRFDLRTTAPYKLVVKETLTLKPEGLRIYARVRKQVARTSATRPAPLPSPVVGQAAAVPAHGTPLLILYGSNSGSSEAFARRIASDGQVRGYAVKVAPLDDHAGMLPKEGAVAIVTASYNGQPPDNARKFMTWLAGVPDGALMGVRYALFGCGNRDWTMTYQSVPKEVAELLDRAGAQAWLERGEGDARADFFGDFEKWYGGFWPALSALLGVAAAEVAAGPLYDVEVVPSASLQLVEENKLGFATIAENRELVDMASPFGRSKRHLEFALPEGVTYAAGDYLAVLPENHPDLVERAARRLGLRPDAAVVLRSTRGAMAASLPTDRPVSIQELLGSHVELSAPATRKNVEALAALNPCPPHQAELAAIAADPDRYQAEILKKRVSVLELLEAWPSCMINLGQFLEMLPAMRVRQYSISSSPRLEPTRCSLTVALVDAPAWSGQGQFRGTCSSYLSRMKAGDQVPVAIKTPNVPFHPPASNATPVVMICAGTGLAPFRGFVQERALRHAAGEAAGPALLFFGCDHPDVDFLYRDELEAWERDGIVTLLPAFFRQPDGDVSFVQHRLWRERDKVRSLFRQGAIVFLCGDGLNMAPAARQTLADIYKEAVGCSDEQASLWLAGMERDGRYVPDVFA